MKKLKVVHVVNSVMLGDGISHVVKEIARHIDRQKFSLSICSLTGNDDDVTDFERCGAHVFCLSARSSVSLPGILYSSWAVLELSRLLRREGFDVLHTHDFFPGALGRLAGWLAGVPIMVLTMHNRYERKKAPHIFIDRWLAKVTDQFIANSWAVKNFTAVQEGIPAHRFEVIYNGVGLSRFDRVGDTSAVRGKLGIKQDELLVGSIGRLVEQKGYQYLIEAAGMLREDRPDVRFVIVGGEGHPSESVKGTLVKQVKELGLETTVIFAGVWRDIPQILVAFDLFVLPSLWEGFGIALVEAMAMRKAIVATRVDAIPEVVEDGISGLLVPPRDSKALAAAIAELLDDPFRRKQMGAAGRWRVESRFTSQIMTKKLESLYESLARDKIRWNGSSLS